MAESRRSDSRSKLRMSSSCKLGKSWGATSTCRSSCCAASELSCESFDLTEDLGAAGLATGAEGRTAEELNGADRSDDAGVEVGGA